MAAAVQRVWTPAEGVSGNVDISSSLNAEFEVVYHVLFDQVHDDVTLVFDADASGTGPVGYDKQIPPFNDARGSYLLLAKKPQRLENPLYWSLTATYKLPTPGQQARPSDPDLLHWAIDSQINPIPFDYENQKDKNGKAILNKAVDAISGVMTQRKLEELVIGFNTTEPNWIGLDAAYGTRGDGTVNSEDVTLVIRGSTRVFAAGTLHFEDYTLAYSLDPDGNTYPRMTYRLRWRPDGWVREVANKGFNELIGGVKKPILVGGQRISSPVYLKTSGADQVVAAAGDDVEFIDVELFDEFDLGAELIFDMDT